MKLQIGYKADFDIRKVSIQLENGIDFTVLYLSDLHLNRFSQTLIKRIIQSIERLNPTIILLGGDYVDTHKGLYYFEKLLNGITPRQNIFAIAGNMEKPYIKSCDMRRKPLIALLLEQISSGEFRTDLGQDMFMAVKVLPLMPKAIF